MGPVPTDYLIELGGGMRPPLGCLFNSTLVDGRQRETALRLPVQTGPGFHYPKSRYTCVLTNSNESNESVKYIHFIERI